MNLTAYQTGQLIYIHFHGDFKYKSDTGTRVANAQWRKMIDALASNDLIQFHTHGANVITLTPKGQAYVDANHLSIKALA